MKIKIENWNGHVIRFVEVKENEWQAIVSDVTTALDIKNSRDAVRKLKPEQKGVATIDTLGGRQRVNTVAEIGIYKLIFKSRKEEAEQFQEWVYETIQKFRQAAGLEGFQIFRMLDKEHQKEAMSKMSRALETPARVDFIKANTIANKAVSSKHGHPKMLKKEQMTPQMLVERQKVLDDTVTLMIAADNFGLDLSISEKVYSKYVQ